MTNDKGQIMKINRKRMMVAGAATVFLLAAVAMSEPGRAALGRVMALILPEAKPAVETSSASTEPQSQDVEQRARQKHGWNAGVATSLLRGSIIYFDKDERAVEQWAVTIYRRYPEQARVEINRGKGVEVYGFDGTKAWRDGAARLTEEEARDIRAMVRIWPERLFVTRARGAAYRESGQRVEPSESGTLIQDQVEMEDTVGPAGAGDRRRVSYYINRESSVVEMASWLEPDDPRRKIDDAGVPLVDVRVEFGKWKSVGGVLWPMEVVHREGGRKDFRIEVNEVVVNAQIDDAKFRER
jgi:hypothetical protein